MAAKKAAAGDKFEDAKKRVEKLSNRPSNDQLLDLYSLYKQATDGDVSGPRPGLLDLKGRLKYDAWAKRKGVSKEEAKKKYVALVDKLAALLAVLLVFLLSANAALAKVVTKPVVYEHAGTKLEGLLAWDDAKTAGGKLPGVLVIPEWWGLNAYVKGRAEQLAAMGYVAFAADMYGQGVVTEDPKKAGELAGPFYGKPLMAERANAGLEQLLKMDRVDPKKVAAIGFCFGGSTAQALAYSGAPLAGIVSFHGGPVNAPASAAGSVKAKFLLLNGANDPMVKPEARAALEKSLEEAKVDYQSVDYAGAVHAFTNPDADRLAAAGGLKGMVGYNEPAARRSWKAMQVFFEEIFGGR